MLCVFEIELGKMANDTGNDFDNNFPTFAD